MAKRYVLAAGTGFLGQALAKSLRRQDSSAEIVVLTRSPKRIPTIAGTREIAWDGRTADASWTGELSGAEAVVNFTGKSVDCRKTAANKAEILRSRVDSVNALHAAMARVAVPPKVWVQTGTAHIFGDSDTQTFTDDSPPADPSSGMAPEVGHAWEHAFYATPTPGTRKVNLRISFVLGPKAGALKTLARLTRLGLGGTIGSGRQPMSWIHIDDMTRLFRSAIEDPSFEKTYIASSPNPLPNHAFMRELRKALHRPWCPPAPAWAVRIGAMLMNTDPELALLGRRVLPTRLMQRNFVFQFPTLTEALRDLLA